MVVETFNYARRKGCLSESQRHAVMTLLEKKGKDNKLISNYRPISLLNCDYKIITNVLTKRLEKHLAKIIHEDQAAFLKGRYMGEVIRFTQKTIVFYDKIIASRHNCSIGLCKSFQFDRIVVFI